LNKEYRIIGTAMVRFTDELPAKDAVKIFNAFRKANKNNLIKEQLCIDDWSAEQAPKVSDIGRISHTIPNIEE
jgi:hypothetical protein